MKYERILVKVSGETLGGASPIDFNNVIKAAQSIKLLWKMGCRVGVVAGGGNIWRGRSSGTMDRSRADNIGMLATAMNSLALEQGLTDLNVPVKTLSAVPMELFMDSYSSRAAHSALDEGKVVIFAGGTGSPFFSTDTAAALRAAQINADALLLAKNVDGIYTADPNVDPNARRYARISYDEVIRLNLKATDLTAISFCREYKIPMRLFAMDGVNGFAKAVSDPSCGTIIDSREGFELA